MVLNYVEYMGVPDVPWRFMSKEVGHGVQTPWTNQRNTCRRRFCEPHGFAHWAAHAPTEPGCQGRRWQQVVGILVTWECYNWASKHQNNPPKEST